MKTPAVNSFLSKWVWIFSVMDISALLVEVFKQKQTEKYRKLCVVLGSGLVFCQLIFQ